MCRFPIFIFLLAGLRVAAQDIKPLDYAPLFKRNQVKTRMCHEIRFKPGRTDTLLLGTAEFDRAGRMIRYAEYFAGGKPFAVYTYRYDDKGKMTEASVEHVFNEMKPVPIHITHDKAGRVSSFEIEESIRNFWKKQTFTYNEKGILISSVQWLDRDGQLVQANKREYPSTLERREGSLTYIQDEKGLEILHQFYSAPGKLERSWRYSYTHF